jgi:drug/metabolite transporter (DMT)-like permease
MMVTAGLFFSLMTVFVKLIGERIPTAEIVFIRSIVVVAITITLLCRTGVSPLGTSKRLLFARGILGFIGVMCFFYAVPRLPLAEVTVIHYLNPVFVAVIAAAALHESLRRWDAVSIAASLGGVVLIARPSGLLPDAVQLDPIAVSAALCGALFAAAAYVTVRKLRETEHALVVVLYFAGVSTLLSLPLFLKAGVVAPTPLEWVYLAGVAVTAQLAQLFVTWAYHADRAARVGAVSYMQIVFATFWGIVLFSEIPGWTSVVGALTIIASTGHISRKRS